jgi:hypothetical protein
MGITYNRSNEDVYKNREYVLDSILMALKDHEEE